MAARLDDRTLQSLPIVDVGTQLEVNGNLFSVVGRSPTQADEGLVLDLGNHYALQYADNEWQFVYSEEKLSILGFSLMKCALLPLDEIRILSPA